jgi:hypothetical protein
MALGRQPATACNSHWSVAICTPLATNALRLSGLRECHFTRMLIGHEPTQAIYFELSISVYYSRFIPPNRYTGARPCRSVTAQSTGQLKHSTGMTHAWHNHGRSINRFERSPDIQTALDAHSLPRGFEPVHDTTKDWRCRFGRQRRLMEYVHLLLFGTLQRPKTDRVRALAFI